MYPLFKLPEREIYVASFTCSIFRRLQFIFWDFSHNCTLWKQDIVKSPFWRTENKVRRSRRDSMEGCRVDISPLFCNCSLYWFFIAHDSPFYRSYRYGCFGLAISMAVVDMELCDNRSETSEWNLWMMTFKLWDNRRWSIDNKSEIVGT